MPGMGAREDNILRASGSFHYQQAARPAKFFRIATAIAQTSGLPPF